MKKNNLKIGVVGLWHLGSVYSACLAKLGYEVVGFDFDRKRTENLQKGIPPIFEPQLEETIKKHLKSSLRYTTDEKEALAKKDYIFVTFDLPVDDNDIVDIKLIAKASNAIFKFASPYTTIIISSQVPLGTSRNVLRKLAKKRINVIYFPENLRLGSAFESFLKPDRIIIGTDSDTAAAKFTKDFSALRCPVQNMSLESAEMVKHALNAYLATCVSFSSEIADLSEVLGADMNDVVKALKTDRRVSPYATINPGLGFAGGTLGRDIQSIKKLSKKIKYEPKLLNSVYSVNRDRLPWLLKKINLIYPNIKNKTIGILGLTYKPNTNTLRRSLSLELAELLNKKGARVKALDPAIKEKVTSHPYIHVGQAYKDFFQGLDLVILMTEWNDFLKIPVDKVAKLMKKRTLIDNKNFLDSKKFKKNKFVFKGVGYK